MFTKVKKFLKSEAKILAISLVAGLLFSAGVAAYSYVYSHATVRDISSNVIRFHVRANSNSPACQALKEHVRTQVLAEFEPMLSHNTDIDETRDVLAGKLECIADFASYVISTAGYNYPVTASLTRQFFPTRFYGSIAFPPGEYEAVQIIIGEGAGANWWCLMFPPLCYVDMTATERSRNMLASSVSDEGVRLLMHQEEPSRELVVRFRVVQWWQNRGQPSDVQRYNIASR